MKLFDTEDLSLEENEDMISEKIEGFIKNNDYLFEKNTPTPVFTASAENKAKKTFTKEEFLKMGYSKRLKLYNEQPDLYNELAGNNE